MKHFETGGRFWPFRLEDPPGESGATDGQFVRVAEGAPSCALIADWFRDQGWLSVRYWLGRRGVEQLQKTQSFIVFEKVEDISALVTAKAVIGLPLGLTWKLGVFSL